jgi:hypothetical protein
VAGTGGAYSDQGAGPFIPEEPDPLIPLSPPELLLCLLERDVEQAICSNVIVGPATQDQQQAGVISITPAGLSTISDHMPLKWVRLQVRCIHHQLAAAEQIGEHVFQLLHTRHRELVTQPSSGNTYLVHHTKCVAGPSTHWDSAATWESLAFYELLIGTQPVS